MKIKGNIILGIGVVLVSVSVLLADVLNPVICDVITGIGLGVEILGLAKQCKEVIKKA